MPTYQYACTDCGHQLEAVQSFSDAALTECPDCQGRLRKVFGAVGVVFKGSGFYRTDSRKNGTSGGAKTTTETPATKTTESAGTGSDASSSSSTSPSTSSSSPSSSPSSGSGSAGAAAKSGAA